MFGIGGFELLMIVVFALLIFGPDKLPQMGQTIGKAVRMFKSAQEDMERVIRAEMYTETDPGAVAAAEKLRESTKPSPSPAAVSAWATDEDDEEEEDEE